MDDGQIALYFIGLGTVVFILVAWAARSRPAPVPSADPEGVDYSTLKQGWRPKHTALLVVTIVICGGFLTRYESLGYIERVDGFGFRDRWTGNLELCIVSSDDPRPRPTLQDVVAAQFMLWTGEVCWFRDK